MGFLSSLFGVKDRTPATNQVVQAAKLPPEIAPFVKEIAGEARDLYRGEIERGYDPYTGQMIAELTPEEQQAMTGIAGLAGATRPFLEEAMTTFRTGAEKFTPETAQEYMSPYQRAVTDIEKREAQRAFEKQDQAREARAVEAGAGSMMGSRAAIEAAEAARNQQQLLGDIEARGLQRAFENAQQQFAAQKARERTMASDVARTGTAMTQADIAGLGALQTVGEQKRALAQSALDEAYGKFLEERNFPQQTLADYSSTIYGNPFARAPSFNRTGSDLPGAPSMGQQLLGLGLTGLNIYGAGTKGGTQSFNVGSAFNPFARRKGGGRLSGLSGLPVIRRQVGGGDLEEETVGADPDLQIMLDAEKPDLSFLGKTTEDVQDSIKRIESGILYDTEKMKEIRKLESENLKTLLADQAARRKELRDPFFTKEEERLKKRSEAYPFALIQRGIAAGMKQPTIATALIEGTATTMEGIDKLGKELDEAKAQLEKQKFEVESQELATEQEQAIQQLTRDADVQIEFLKLDATAKKEVMALVKLGIDLKTALAQYAKASKPDTIKLTEPVRKTAEKAAADALGLTVKFDDDGNLLFTGKLDGSKMSPADATNAQLWNQDFNKAFGVFMSRLNNEPLAASRAAAYAKQEHRKRQQQNTQLPAGGPRVPTDVGPPSNVTDLKTLKSG
tara:strand:+ start:1050 stop:3080 length:2031 start_codon:yes stop_codon:yes gene_type:complete